MRLKKVLFIGTVFLSSKVLALPNCSNGPNGESTVAILNYYTGRLDCVTAISTNALGVGYIQNKNTLQAGATAYPDFLVVGTSATINKLVVPFGIKASSIQLNGEVSAAAQPGYILGSKGSAAAESGIMICNNEFGSIFCSTITSKNLTLSGKVSASQFGANTIAPPGNPSAFNLLNLSDLSSIQFDDELFSGGEILLFQPHDLGGNTLGLTMPSSGTVGGYLQLESDPTTGIIVGTGQLAFARPSIYNFSTQTDSYTVTLADEGKCLSINKTTANTITVPSHASVALSTGTTIRILQLGAGQITLTPASGVNLFSQSSAFKMAGQYAMAVLIKIASNTWVVDGNLTP